MINIEYKKYFIAFLDVLGFKKIIYESHLQIQTIANS